METTLNTLWLTLLGRVFDESKGSKLSEEMFNKIDGELELLGGYFQTPKINTFFISLVVAMSTKSETVKFEDLTKHLDVNPLKILEYVDVFKSAVENQILIKNKPTENKGLINQETKFSVEKAIMEAIIFNKEIPQKSKASYPGLLELFEALYELSEKRVNEDIETTELLDYATELFTNHEDTYFIKTINELIPEISNRYIFVYLVWETLTGSKSVEITYILEKIFEKPTERIRMFQSIISDENPLIKGELMEIVSAGWFSDTGLKLTDKSKEMLKNAGINIFTEKQKNENVIEVDKITFKELLFNEDESKQINALSSLLKEDTFKEMQKRLGQKNLPCGITALLHGTPGTGKTETVLQLAKLSGRNILKVDISGTKSMWFGQSEKLIKKVFTDYYELSKKSELTPILFFNEADAIISKRKDSKETQVAQTENAIQNIILEELEKFDGIFFATTNMIMNIDKAFERRFLYKIEFHKPQNDVKTSLWKLKLPFLTIKQCEFISKQFDFSGAQIENILRKCELKEIVNGLSVTFDEILEFCQSERFTDKQKIKIGFHKN